MESNELALVTRLLDVLGSPQEDQLTIKTLLEAGDVDGVARTIAASAKFERLYKEVRAGKVQPIGRKEADPAFVGLPNLDQNLRFGEQFAKCYGPQLEARAEGFGAIFGALSKVPEKPLIIETGCLRIPGNWAGDGQSTFMFDAFARAEDATFISIDLTLESIDSARKACSSSTTLILGDSVAALHSLSRNIRRQANLLYLDSFDLDSGNPMPSAIHHAMELMAARSLIGPGTIVCVDDYLVDGQIGGKGLLIDQYFSSIRTAVLYTGYQKIWQVG